MMEKYIKQIIGITLLLCLFLVAETSAQFNFYDDSRQLAPPKLRLDYASFKSSDSGKTRLELYYQVYNTGFKFEQRGVEYVAEYELSIFVDDDKDLQAASESRDKKIIVANEEKTRSVTDFRTSQINFDLSPGKYKVKLVLSDKISGKIVSTDFEVKLADYYNQSVPQLSDIEFIQTISAPGVSKSVFDKGNIIAIPSVLRSYGGDDKTKLLYYIEIYQGLDTTENVDVETKIRKGSGMMIYRDTLNDIFNNSTELQLREISVEDFSPGEYELEIYLRGRRNKKIFEKKDKFTVQWTIQGLVKHDFNSALEQLAIIAQPGEIKKMKKIESLEQRMEAFQQFWKERDTSPGTARNEFQLEFYRRVNFANRHFGSLRREGWRSDRGRVLIKFGEPDEIDDNPMSLSSPPYQIWHFYKIGKYRKFVFVDENEDGEYRLQFPYDGLDQNPDY